MADLEVKGSTTLATVSGIVTGNVTLGPGLNGDRGPAMWRVTGVIVTSSRPGVAPIPRVVIVDKLGTIKGVSYDGSFDSGPADITLGRGDYLSATWTGGANGDVVTMTLSGSKQ